MKFKNYPYQRINIKETIDAINDMQKRFAIASDIKEQIECIEEFNALCLHVSTMENLVYVRHTIDTRDKFYDEEQNFIDEKGPSIKSAQTEFIKVLLKSSFRKELEETFGVHLFNLLEAQLKSFDEKIMEEVIVENKLITKYNRLIASCEIEFAGKKYNLSQLNAFFENDNREIRKNAQETYWNFFIEHEKEFDEIYDELVKIRDKMAKKMGYQNYVEFGYYRLGRTDYNSEMVANYRKQIAEYVVPISQELYKRQQKRMDIDQLYYYDLPVEFKSGNPTPKGTPDKLVKMAQEMYAEMSLDTKEFFDFMIEHELMDLVAKPGKEGGGYCTYFSDFQSPFIFSNFNGTKGDVDVLTHEAGHAFQVYQSRNVKIAEYIWPTYEACEIHSMSMEFFAWPWMEKFFEEDTAKYRFSHLQSALKFIPYGASIDEFQHYVYENPEATPQMRKSKYREIEKKYVPHKNYENNVFLNNGGLWMRQSHVFASPFYYIDYTLAQVCALQYLIKDMENHQTAWNNYLSLCKLGGTKSFLDLLKTVKLDNPFNDGTINKICLKCKNILDNMDDSKF